MVEIIKKKFDQDLFLNLWCNPLGYFAKMNSTLGSVVPLAMFNRSSNYRDGTGAKGEGTSP